MNFKKSMISVAAASLLAVSFVGCGDGSTSTAASTTDATNKGTIISNPKGTVTGLVQDTNGNPIAGVLVYLADKNATTNAGGLYTFNDVSVTNTVGADAPTANNVLSVTIAAPAGFVGATVTVSPSAQLDSAEGATTTSGTETFIDGYLAQAGTAVLPELNGSVTGVLRNTNTGAALAGVEIVLEFVSGGTAAATAQEQAQNGVATTYAVSTYRATTDATGTYSFTSIPSDSTFTATAPGYILTAGTAVIGFATDAETTTTLGDSTALKIVSRDIISPLVRNSSLLSPVASSLSSIAASTVPGRALLAGSTLLMLEDDVRNSITINFSESIDTLSENDDDNTKSVRVYDWSTSNYMDLSAAGAVVISGNTLTINFPNPLTNGQEFDVNLLITDFKDTSGNKLTITDAAPTDTVDDTATSVLSPAGTQSVRLQLKAFTDLNLDATAVTAQAQMEKDTFSTPTAAEQTTRTYANAFNDVDTTTAAIEGFNTLEADARLTALSVAQGPGVAVDTTMARITFTPSNATSYVLSLKSRTGTVKSLQMTATSNVNNSAGPTAATNNTTAIGIVTDDNVTPVEIVLDSTGVSALAFGDVLTIIPLNDDGYAGTAQTITLNDNVAATTVLQRSYMGATALTNAGGAVTTFGGGGELANNYALSAAVGTPILGLTPGLLDNLDAAGNNILDDNTAVTADQTLNRELFIFNGKNAATPPVRVINIANVYDNTAFKSLNGDREIGVTFSEDVNLSGVTPTYTGSSVTSGSYVVNNNVTVDDNGVANLVDLVNFKTTDVMALANDNHGKVMSFDGILDAKGNVASNADIVTEDMMPPFVTKAEYTGANLIITFNEAITAPTTGAGTVTINVRNAGDTDDRDIVLDTSLINTATQATWSLDATSKVLTITANYLALTTNSLAAINTLQSLFDAGSYIETDYDTTAKQHARLEFNNIQDASSNTNSWTNWNATKIPGEVPAVEFAAVDMIGTFTVLADPSNFNIGDDIDAVAQEVVWTFSHAIAVDSAGATSVTEFFDIDDAGVSINTTTGVMTATNVALRAAGAWDGVGTNDFEQTIAGVNVAPAAYNAAGMSFDNVGSYMSLAADRKTLTFTFRGTGGGTLLLAGDLVKFTGTAGAKTAFKSVYTADEIIGLTANTQ
ncbi:hypothetical protein JHD49_03820 [Sulfurimonas sp. SAG-AH-194-C21]|nr:hypothetical protein [Sulfurimonas sp. SAG-AH-194-C21]MDF1883059.1 hypothetical protein [Sulfurimonas sp. SAG-AH-194-C21]